MKCRICGNLENNKEYENFAKENVEAAKLKKEDEKLILENLS